MKTKKPRTTGASRSNVFRDVGLSASQAERMRVRAELLAALQETLRAKKLRQVEAAAWLGIRQPRVSQLLQGRIDLFSSDALVELLARAGVRVRFGPLTGGRSV
ncbi:MAG: helix-turn-helix transcriptional regulator [Planctomycetota bacterium]